MITLPIARMAPIGRLGNARVIRRTTSVSNLLVSPCCVPLTRTVRVPPVWVWFTRFHSVLVSEQVAERENLKSTSCCYPSSTATPDMRTGWQPCMRARGRHPRRTRGKLDCLFRRLGRPLSLFSNPCSCPPVFLFSNPVHHTRRTNFLNPQCDDNPHFRGGFRRQTQVDCNYSSYILSNRTIPPA